MCISSSRVAVRDLSSTCPSPPKSRRHRCSDSSGCVAVDGAATRNAGPPESRGQTPSTENQTGGRPACRARFQDTGAVTARVRYARRTSSRRPVSGSLAGTQLAKLARHTKGRHRVKGATPLPAASTPKGCDVDDTPGPPTAATANPAALPPQHGETPRLTRDSGRTRPHRSKGRTPPPSAQRDDLTVVDASPGAADVHDVCPLGNANRSSQDVPGAAAGWPRHRREAGEPVRSGAGNYRSWARNRPDEVDTRADDLGLFDANADNDLLTTERVVALAREANAVYILEHFGVDPDAVEAPSADAPGSPSQPSPPSSGALQSGSFSPGSGASSSPAAAGSARASPLLPGVALEVADDPLRGLARDRRSHEGQSLDPEHVVLDVLARQGGLCVHSCSSLAAAAAAARIAAGRQLA